MSEEQQFQGDRWTTQSVSILKNLGWEKKGSSNFDVKCVRPTEHTTTPEAKRRINPHGVDSIFSYFDPFSTNQTDVIVESKHRVWSGISTSTIQKFVDQLLMTVECSRLSGELSDLGCSSVNTGLLMIWCHEVDQYNQEKFNEYLSELKVESRRAPITIYIASNREILRWCSLIEKIKEIKSDSYVEEFKIFYPGGDFNRISNRRDHFTLEMLFSSYIFAKSKELRDGGKRATYQVDVNHVFFYAKPTKEELDFMSTLITRYQLEDADELHIHFQGEQTKYRKDIEQFINELGQKFKKADKELEVKVDYLIDLKKVPENYSREMQV